MRRRGLTGVLLVLAALLFVVPSADTYYTDWLWFRELGYEGVFLKTLNAQAVVFAGTFLAVFVFLFVNLRIATSTFSRPHVTLATGIDGRPITVDRRQIAGFALPVALLLALVFGFAGASNWWSWLNFFNGVPFGQTDPLFGRDIGFYVYRLPVLQAVRQEAFVVAMLTLVGSGVYYVLSGSFIIDTRQGAGFWPRFRLIESARRHIGVLAAIVLALLAWGAWLEIPSTLLTPASVIFGASYVDVHANLPVLRISVAVLSVGSILALVYGFTRRAWPLPLALLLYGAVSIGGGMYAAFVQRFTVDPNELNTEQPYIVNNIEATRRAYALDRVEERELSGDAELTAQDIINNASTVENIRLWDHQPLLQTFAQIQEIRTYYDFVSVDNDRYMIDGKYRQVMLSARELNSESMQNRSWVNERLTFTHGYGLTLGPVNQVTTEGLPALFIRDLPPVSTVGLGVDQPSIYFGELSNDYVIVRSKQPEFHYPKGDDNETTFYDGTGGVPVGSLWRRLLFAIRFANTNILFSNQITNESRIMYHRQIVDRVRTLAPFLSYDSDPYPVLADGRLFWIQDAYTTSANYPYATPTVRAGVALNYIRNSVKIVIDAYHGSTSLYLAEPGDPLALTLGNIFPGLLHPLSEMPAELREHVRYPEDIFRIQSAVFQSYHMTNPLVFYNKEDQWQVPSLEVDRSSVTMQPYYAVMRLPGEKQAEFLQMLPFTPRLKENLAAWMVARSDADHYGRMLVFQFPKQKIIFGPKQIVGRINQDPSISPQISLWNQQGSEVIWGTLLVIPINESLLYVRPLYLRSPEGRIPELKQVIVAYQSRIVMAETLNQALGRIFGASVAAALSPDRLASSATSVVETSPEAPTAAPEAPGAAPSWESLVAEMRQHFDLADRALRAGDLATYGEEMKKARAVLEQMEKLRK